MSKDVCLFMYSHSSYSDAWEPFIEQADAYMPSYTKMVFADKDMGKIPSHWRFISYNEDQTYSERIASCLEQVDSEVCILHHEDMFLYDQPQIDKMFEYENLVRNSSIDFIRLLRSVDDPTFPYRGSDTLYPIPTHSKYFFSVQPSICKTDSLIKIYKNTKINHLREFEIKVQQTCRKLNISGLFHYDTSVYPYIATAIVKGQWNLSGYPKRLKHILDKYKIDTTLRGHI